MLMKTSMRSCALKTARMIVLRTAYPLKLAAAAFAALVCAFLFSQTWPAGAQSGTVSWDAPVNLSTSGGTTDPRIIANSERVMLVVWDRLTPAGPEIQSGYSIPDEEGWSDPVWAEFPFSGRPVQFIGTDTNRIHAFWIDQDAGLRHSSNPEASFGNPGSWAGAVLIAPSVVSFDAVIDPNGITHLSFLTTQESQIGPPGVYYVRTLPNGITWQTPENVYSSDYYVQFDGLRGRAVDPSLGSAAIPEVDIEASGDGESVQLFLAWGNPAVKRVLMSRSTDAGRSWEPAEQVDGPEAGNPYRTPRGLITRSTNQNLLRVWNQVQQGGSCTVTYQVSKNAGDSWGEPAVLFDELNQCPEQVNSFPMPTGEELFTIQIGQQIYFLLWDGGQWSDPQLQQGLEFFTDPVTYSFVQLGCQDLSLAGDEITVAGCDLAEGSDIWLLRGQILDTEQWFQSEYQWQERAILKVASADVLSMSSVYDVEGALHVLWSVPEQETDRVASSIFYGGWDQGRLVGPFEIIGGVPGVVTNLSIIAGDQGEILAAWNGGQFGEIFFTSTSLQEAPSSRGWLEPEMIVAPGNSASLSNLHMSPDGSVLLAYVVPANQGKGIYLLSSEDAGRSWNETSQFTQPQGQQCPLLKSPGLLARENELHIIWTCTTLPGGVGPLSLHHIIYDRQSAQWSEPGVVAESPVIWSRVIEDGMGSIHLVWVESETGRTRTRHAVYQPEAGAWAEPSVVFTQTDEGSQSSLTVDAGGRLHITQLAAGDRSSLLQQKTWNGATWSSGNSYSPRLQGPAAALETQISGSGDLIAIIMGTGRSGYSQEQEDRLVLAQITVRDEPVVNEEARAEAAQQATLSGPAEQDPAQDGSAGAGGSEPVASQISSNSDPIPDAPASSFSGLVIGVVAALGVVGIILIRRLRSS